MTMKEIGKGQDGKSLLFKSTDFEEYGLIIVNGKKAEGAFFVDSKEEMKAILRNILAEIENE